MGLGIIKVQISDDFKINDGSQFLKDTFLMSVRGKWRREKIYSNCIDEIKIISDRGAVNVGRAVGFGGLGSLLFGGLGLLGGAFLGGRGKKVTFGCRFTSGRYFVGTTDQKTFDRINLLYEANKFKNKGE